MVQKAARGRPTPPGGKRRSRADILKLIDVCEEAMALQMPKSQIRALLGKAAGKVGQDGTPAPLSLRTTEKYIARVNQRHQENPLPGLEQARAQAERRYRRMITRLYADGPTKNSTAIWRWEDRLARLRGLDAPTNTVVTGPEGGPIVVKPVSEVVAAFTRLAEKTPT